jgi:hypothetical protein
MRDSDFLMPVPASFAFGCSFAGTGPVRSLSSTSTAWRRARCGLGLFTGVPFPALSGRRHQDLPGSLVPLRAHAALIDPGGGRARPAAARTCCLPRLRPCRPRRLACSRVHGDRYRGSLTRPMLSLCTLHLGVTPVGATLAAGWWGHTLPGRDSHPLGNFAEFCLGELHLDSSQPGLFLAHLKQRTRTALLSCPPTPTHR